FSRVLFRPPGVIVGPARARDGRSRLVRSRLGPGATGTAPDRLRVVAGPKHARADADHGRSLGDRELEVPAHAHRQFGRLGGHDALLPQPFAQFAQIGVAGADLLGAA